MVAIRFLSINRVFYFYISKSITGVGKDWTGLIKKIKINRKLKKSGATPGANVASIIYLELLIHEESNKPKFVITYHLSIFSFSDYFINKRLTILKMMLKC